MTSLLEDFLTDDDLKAIQAIFASKEARFDRLVAISGLNPATDFQFSELKRLDLRGADLRGFDFTGSDLRQSVVSETTRIDRTTVLKDALVDWIEVEALPIVERMQAVELATDSKKRQAKLADLVAEFGRSDHVVTYVVKAASNAKNIEEFLDFITQLPETLSAEQFSIIRRQSSKLLSKKLNRAKSRTRREGTAIFAGEPILERLRTSPGKLGRVVLGYLAEVSGAKEQVKALGSFATIELRDIEKAFSRLGQS